MTNNELLELVSFESVKNVEILSQSKLPNNATFIFAHLIYEDDDWQEIPFVYYEGQNWIFTPQDWQGWLPSDPEEIAEINWRVDNTEIFAVMFDGIPMLNPWVAEEPNPKRAARKRIGQQLKEARENKGFSIRQFADICGINKSQICRVEAGRLNVGIDTIAAMADALDLTLTLEQ